MDRGHQGGQVLGEGFSKTRGVADILIAITDGLKGMAEALLTVVSRPRRCRLASCT
mgnify:CR=1 FL=1